MPSKVKRAQTGGKRKVVKKNTKKASKSGSMRKPKRSSKKVQKGGIKCTMKTFPIFGTCICDRTQSDVISNARAEKDYSADPICNKTYNRAEQCGRPASSHPKK